MSKAESNFESPQKKPAVRRKKAKTLEFNFENDAAPSLPAAPPAFKRSFKKSESKSEPKPEPRAETSEPVAEKFLQPLPPPEATLPAPEIRVPVKKETVPKPEPAKPFPIRSESTLIKETIPMTPSKPSPVNVRSSIERQTREQQAVGTVLNGVAIAFICGIVLVASLASLGGYVLFKQIRNQSATIALLESNMRERMDNFQSAVDQKDLELALSQKESNLRLTTLQGEFETYRNKTSQSIAQLASANAKLEQRLAAYRQDFNNRQEALLAEYRRNR